MNQSENSAANSAEQEKGVICSVHAYKGYGKVGWFVTVCALCFVLFFALIPNERISDGDEFDNLKRLVCCLIVGIPLGGGGIFILLYSYVWKIDLYEDEFAYRNSFGITRRYKYKDVTVKELSAVCRYYKGKKHIVGVPYGYDNCEILIEKCNIYDE